MEQCPGEPMDKVFASSLTKYLCFFCNALDFSSHFDGFHTCDSEIIHVSLDCLGLLRCNHLWLRSILGFLSMFGNAPTLVGFEILSNCYD